MWQSTAPSWNTLHQDFSTTAHTLIQILGTYYVAGPVLGAGHTTMDDTDSSETDMQTQGRGHVTAF